MKLVVGAKRISEWSSSFFKNRLIEHNAVLSAASHLYMRVNDLEIRFSDCITVVYFQVAASGNRCIQMLF